MRRKGVPQTMQHGATFLSLNKAIPPMLHEDITDERAWKRETLSPADWLVPFPQACVAELDAVVQMLRHCPQPVAQLSPAAFALTACAQIMAHVHVQMHSRVGFAVVDRVPVERYSVTENCAIGWLLASLLGQVVAQKWDGTLLYEVKDAGKPLGHGVRRSVTNLAQPFHTDGGWLWMPPSAIGLFCLQPAQQGGLSRLVSLFTVHNELQRRRPDLLARLYRPFWWDRQAEHAPNDVCVSRHPVYQYDGRTLMARYYEDYVCNGSRLAGEELDTEGTADLAAVRAILDTPENWVEFRVEQGQLQYINNLQFAHARTAFSDMPGVRSQRHMLRLWNRDEGTVGLEGQADTV
jgi:alpha-ketoglutarate-dependent taurine dioxygenase